MSSIRGTNNEPGGEWLEPPNSISGRRAVDRGPRDITAAVRSAGPRGVNARDLGRSYGDPARNGSGLLIDGTPLNRIRSIDPDTEIADVDNEVSLNALIKAVDYLSRNVDHLGVYTPRRVTLSLS
ncbi:hypothetical protein [Mycolicibacterium komossense]|uniref:FAD-binding oxidoreductase n=1 Tax=Mycolicibacterium komossense TaxID=1779 RepID=A0ABT3CFM4_9MYCO|nr:hypothetical protein [Mycolicibacterium komossense]MCV7228192.1 FAD-binding oxidoreductase [Mycolicibacterium komossense]